VVIDTSAIVAILAEPDGPGLLGAMRRAPSRAMSAVSYHETRTVLTGRRDGRPRFDPTLLDRFDALVDTTGIVVVPFDRAQAMEAHAAYLRFGKGFHRAALNLADCASYALSRLRREPLLFKGEDFARTDVEAVSA
jgi:ribonuclease VapC